MSELCDEHEVKWKISPDKTDRLNPVSFSDNGYGFITISLDQKIDIGTGINTTTDIKTGLDRSW